MDKRHIGITILVFDFALCALAIGLLPGLANIEPGRVFLADRTIKVLTIILMAFGIFYFLQDPI